jgi:putative transposase
MECVACGGIAISDRPERTARGYRRFRCHDCGEQFNKRTGGSLNRTQYPSDVIALVVFWRLRYKLSLRDLPEMFLLRGIEFTYEAVRDWETKLTPLLIDNLRRRRGGGRRVRRSWYVDDETCVKVNGRWCYLLTALARWSTLC